MDFPANLTHQCQYFMSSCSGAYDLNTDNVNGNKQADKDTDSGIVTNSEDKNLISR